MHRTDSAGSTADHLFTNGDPASGIHPTWVDAAWLNDVQENLSRAIEAAGIALVKGDYTQLRQAIAQLIAQHNQSGTAHADIRALIASLGGSRYETMWLGAGAMIPSKTNGATAATGQTTSYLLTEDYLDYSASVDQAAEIAMQLPANWDRGTVKVKLHWRPAAAGATAGQYVGWAISAGAVGDSDTVDRALGAVVTVADQALAGLAGVEHVTPASAAITIGGAPQVGDRLHLKIARDADYAGGGAAMPVMARLLGIELQYGVSGTVAAWG